MPARVVGVILNDFGLWTTEGLLDMVNGNLACITLLLCMQSQPITSGSDKGKESIKHAPTLLEQSGKCNESCRARPASLRNPLETTPFPDRQLSRSLVNQRLDPFRPCQPKT